MSVTVVKEGSVKIWKKRRKSGQKNDVSPNGKEIWAGGGKGGSFSSYTSTICWLYSVSLDM